MSYNKKCIQRELKIEIETKTKKRTGKQGKSKKVF